MVEATSIPGRVRAACAWVAGRSRSVSIDGAAVAGYASGLLGAADLAAPDPDTDLGGADRETGITFVICLDAINFGSGWWPTIRKRPGRSGYSTIAAGLAERFRARGAWPAAELVEIEASEISSVLGQEPDHPLMSQFAVALSDVGAHVLADHGGSFAALAEAAGGSAVALADLLAGWQSFADVSTYSGREIPLYKRAQIAAADLDRSGLADLADIYQLTAFADNLVPHVLRVDGLLRLDPALEAAIEAGELLEHGSPEEVELRACTVHAVELLSDATDRCLSPAQIDEALWSRGRAPRYKSIPRPRSRNTAY